MARCGCSGECGCALTAGEGIIVSGAGSAANPWVVSGTTNCAQVRNCLIGGDGIFYNAANGNISICFSGDLGNTASIGSDSCLYVGTDCTAVRQCLDDGPGLNYSSGTGVFSVCISPNPGNNLTLDDNDCLFVPTGAATVTSGCGILGDGSGGSPVRAHGQTWSWPCSQSIANGTGVYCDPATGQLQGEPEHEFRFRTFSSTFTYANLAVPAAADTVIQAISASTTNPSNCRTCQVVAIQEVDWFFSLPAGASAAWGQGGDEFGRIANTGSTGFSNYHIQQMKMFSIDTALAAGAGITHNWDVTMGRGTGGATYSQVVVNTRFLMQTN